MIRGCHVLRSRLQLGNARRHFRASFIATAYDESSKGGSAPLTEPILHQLEKSETEGNAIEVVRLQPGLQICDALFEAESPASKRGPSKSITTPQCDAQNLVVCSRGRQSPLSASNRNVLDARRYHIGDIPGPNDILQSILSVVTSPAAIKQRLDAHEATTYQSAPSLNFFRLFSQKFSTIFSETSPVVRRDSWHDRYMTQQWLHVITGWSNYGVGGVGEQRAWCLYNLGPDLNPPYWDAYVQILCHFGTSEAIYKEWMFFQQKHGGCTEALNFTVQSLVKLKDPEKAWALVYESEGAADSMSEETLELLLAYPQYAKAWKPRMNDPAVRMLEKQISKVEQQLGLRWEGGENGFHRTGGS